MLLFKVVWGEDQFKSSKQGRTFASNDVRVSLKISLLASELSKDIILEYKRKD